MNGYITNISIEAPSGGLLRITVEMSLQVRLSDPDRYTYTGEPHKFDIVSEILQEWWYMGELVDSEDVQDLLADRHVGVDEP